jgi:hypothetical protein
LLRPVIVADILAAGTEVEVAVGETTTAGVEVEEAVSTTIETDLASGAAPMIGAAGVASEMNGIERIDILRTWTAPSIANLGMSGSFCQNGREMSLCSRDPNRLHESLPCRQQRTCRLLP